MMQLFLFYSIVFQLFSLNINHPVHLSVTNIDYLQEEKKIEISVRLFIDDFEQIMNSKYMVKLNLNTPTEHKKSDIYIEKYINEHLRFYVNGSKKISKQMKMIKKLSKELEMWVYFELPIRVRINSIEIQNSILTDLYNDQTNLLIYTNTDKQFAVKFDNEKRIETIIN